MFAIEIGILAIDQGQAREDSELSKLTVISIHDVP
jgi:hypothetical protein